ncbi:MAG: hypothetical protein EA408_04770 [Marinilabiliales bacterium]|nr:MAG: hypothetical protein EA408_04770 [Marinilabiliales bacterium]
MVRQKRHGKKLLLNSIDCGGYAGAFLCPFLIAVAVFAVASCTGTRHLGDDQSLYSGSRIYIEPGEQAENLNEMERELESVLSPRPNSSILFMRPRLWVYHITGTTRERGIGNWIKTRIGRPPVLIEDVNPERTTRLMQNRLFNMGHFDTDVTYSLAEKKKQTRINYHVNISAPYRIGRIILPGTATEAGQAVVRAMENTELRSGDIYSLARLKSERSRIERQLKEEGFFYFNADHIIFRADSTAGNREVDLHLAVKTDVPSYALRSYRIGNIMIMQEGIAPTAGVSQGSRSGTGNASQGSSGLDGSATAGNRFTVIENGVSAALEELPVSERVLLNSLFLEQGQVYNSSDHLLTISHLMGLGVFKFVNIRFERRPSGNALQPPPPASAGDLESENQSASNPENGVGVNRHPSNSGNGGNENLLDVRIILTPMEKKNISAELSGVSKSNNFAGPGFTASFSNRNLLGGAENFSIGLDGAFETLIGQKGVNSIEAGLTSEIGIPGLLIPFRHSAVSHGYMPRTRMSLAFSYLDRTDAFSLSSFKSQFGYHWNPAQHVQHRFNPFVFNVFGLGRISDEYRQIFSDEALLRRGMFEQFLLGSEYSFFYNTLVTGDDRNLWYFNINADMSGNMAWLAGRYGGFAGEGAAGEYTFFNQGFAQYFKTDIDVRHYIGTKNGNRIAARLIAGAGIPYGNSSSLPYTKVFTIGGSNSIRAFHPRSVGPGSYSPPDTLVSTLNIYQSGELKFEMNLEYRIDLGNIFKAALFADAGNIWNIREKENAPGGAFIPSQFLRQIALGTGAGIRLDFTFFLLRLDVAFPLAIPGQNDHAGYFRRPDPLDPQWRRDNIILNLAIGYPF